MSLAGRQPVSGSMTTASPHADKRLPIVVLISGRGSNLQSIVSHMQSGELPIELRAVISNRADAPGLNVARVAGITTRIIEHDRFTDRAAFDTALADAIDEFQPGLVVLAGFMRILTPAFVAHYHNRLLNIHPSLLPAFRGLHTHERALDAGVSKHGASVHYVTENLDGGTVVMQVTVPVRDDDTVESLANRVLEEEHKLYPLAIRLVAEGRIKPDNHRFTFDGTPVNQPLDMRNLLTEPAFE